MTKSVEVFQPHVRHHGGLLPMREFFEMDCFAFEHVLGFYKINAITGKITHLGIF